MPDRGSDHARRLKEVGGRLGESACSGFETEALLPGLLALARMIHEHFCCNRQSAVPTHLRSTGSPLQTFDVLHEDASGPPGSARRSHDAPWQFRDELS